MKTPPRLGRPDLGQAPAKGRGARMARGRGEVSWRGPATTACRPQASHPLNQLPGLAVTRGNGEKSRDAKLEAE